MIEKSLSTHFRPYLIQAVWRQFSQLCRLDRAVFLQSDWNAFVIRSWVFRFSYATESSYDLHTPVIKPVADWSSWSQHGGTAYCTVMCRLLSVGSFKVKKMLKNK